MKALNSLDLDFKTTQCNIETLDECIQIYNYCNQLRNLTIDGRFNGDQIISFVEELIEQVKLNLNQRSSPLTLNLGGVFDIITFIAIRQRVESVSDKLIVEFRRIKEDRNELKQALPLI